MVIVHVRDGFEIAVDPDTADLARPRKLGVAYQLTSKSM